MMTSTLYYSGTWDLGNGWDHSLDVHVERNGDADLLRASFGPSDVEWDQDTEGNWIADPLVVAVAVALSGDGGCSCGHNGGTSEHPGTNHP